MKFIDLKKRVEVAIISSPTVLCIGDFDGVHLGHRQLVASVLQKIKIIKNEYPNIVGGAWFFDSNTYKAAKEIYTIEEKLNVFADLGLDYAIIADFDEMKSLSPESFVRDVLQTGCGCIHAVCGENFRFGAKASGDSNFLKELMHGNATIVPLMSVDGSTVISSTYIRELLASGDIFKANSLLGKPYTVCETVIHGKALGRKLGIPTINQNIQGKQFILKNGIYSTLCTVDGKKYFGVTNVGVRPTVDDDGHKNIETHIIDFNADCYGKKIKIEFLHRIRDEMKFESIDTLKEQIQKDIAATIYYFNK
ncbi:MAG: bifunctional riboflavin kinase/FAD synthetase [Clostridia bacterium]|nr:bifunctional riboflavin kinase/FAD synthetase [Clostridia bacterium]